MVAFSIFTGFLKLSLRFEGSNWARLVDSIQYCPLGDIIFLARLLAPLAAIAANCLYVEGQRCRRRLRLCPHDQQRQLTACLVAPYDRFPIYLSVGSLKLAPYWGRLAASLIIVANQGEWRLQMAPFR